MHVRDGRDKGQISDPVHAPKLLAVGPLGRLELEEKADDDGDYGGEWQIDVEEGRPIRGSESAADGRSWPRETSALETSCLVR